MDRFAFMLHPLDLSDLTRKYGFMKYFPNGLLEWLGRHLPPVKASHITGITSDYSGKTIEGWFVGCPLTSEQIMSMPTDVVLDKIIATGKLAERLGAQILGLGAFTSVAGDAGVTVAKNLDIPVTTGNSYTIATALTGTRRAARLMGIDFQNAEIAVVGATGAIGTVVSELLARNAKYLTLVGRDEVKLRKLSDRLREQLGLAVSVSTEIERTIPRADVVVAVSSAVEAIIDAQHLKSGAVVCDVARPRDVSVRVAETRDDVFVLEGGVVDVPGEVEFNFNFGYPPKTSLACMAETMALTLEGRFESFTLGRHISVKQVDEINEIARKHGFELSGFRSFERAISTEEIETIKQNVNQERAAGREHNNIGL
jgi:predicted amino acid dehydrogenase